MALIWFFPAEARVASFTVREERLGGETISFSRQYPRIYGLSDAEAQDHINRQLRQKTYAEYLAACARAKQSDDKATGSVIAKVIFQSDGLICLEVNTHVTFLREGSLQKTEYLSFSQVTGKRLYFWDLFIKDGAKREAVQDRLISAAALYSGPEKEWVLMKISAADALPFRFNTEKAALDLILSDGGEPQKLLSVPLDGLEGLFEPELKIG